MTNQSTSSELPIMEQVRRAFMRHDVDATVGVMPFGDNAVRLSLTDYNMFVEPTMQDDLVSRCVQHRYDFDKEQWTGYYNTKGTKSLIKWLNQRSVKSQKVPAFKQSVQDVVTKEQAMGYLELEYSLVEARIREFNATCGRYIFTDALNYLAYLSIRGTFTIDPINHPGKIIASVDPAWMFFTPREPKEGTTQLLVNIHRRHMDFISKMDNIPYATHGGPSRYMFLIKNLDKFCWLLNELSQLWHRTLTCRESKTITATPAE